MRIHSKALKCAIAAYRPVCIFFTGLSSVFLSSAVNGIGFGTTIENETTDSIVYQVNKVSLENASADDLFLTARDGGSWNDGDNVELRSWSGEEGQVWELNRLSDNQFKLHVNGTNYVLRANSGGDGWQNLDNVEVRAWEDIGSQKWYPKWNTRGITTFENTSGYFLHGIKGSNSEWDSGDNVSVYEERTWYSQRWDVEMLENVDGPSIVKSPNGNILAYLKHEISEDNYKGYIMKKNGNQWEKIRTFDEEIYGPTLFTYNDVLYMIYCEGKELILRKSTNNGWGWARYKLMDLPGNVNYGSGGGAPVLITNDRIYYGCMDKGGNGDRYPEDNRLRVASWPTSGTSITSGSEWKISGPATFPENPSVSGTRNAWTEPNLVEYDNQVWVFARVDSHNGNVTACLKVNNDGDDLGFVDRYPVNEAGNAHLLTGFMNADWAGSGKFHIVEKTDTDTYYIIGNRHSGLNANQPVHWLGELDPEDQWLDRNELVLYKTKDFRKFDHVRTLLTDDLITNDAQASVNLTGFQQPSFIIDGSKIRFLSRTAYGTFDNLHDANIISYHETGI